MSALEWNECCVLLHSNGSGSFRGKTLVAVESLITAKGDTIIAKRGSNRLFSPLHH